MSCGGKGYIEIDDETEKSVAIVAMGMSAYDYVSAAMPFGGLEATETWGINFAAGVLRCDACIMMDDLYESLDRSKDVPLAVKFHHDLKTMGIPIITTQHYPEWPMSFPYPLPEVINAVGVPYFNNSVAYAVGLAMYHKFDHILLYGADFTYPNSHVGEQGRGNVEFLLGQAERQGTKVSIARNSNLMDTNVPVPERLYGYKSPPAVVGVGEGKGMSWQWHNDLLFRKFEPLNPVPCTLCKGGKRVRTPDGEMTCWRCHGSGMLPNLETDTPKRDVPLKFRKFGSVEKIAQQGKRDILFRKFGNA
ncbi:MAG: hypothetical protein GY841_16145 [FCB group bacterium]|nr:hypothetical protein [FCB group bacterium]